MAQSFETCGDAIEGTENVPLSFIGGPDGSVGGAIRDTPTIWGRASARGGQGFISRSWSSDVPNSWFVEDQAGNPIQGDRPKIIARVGNTISSYGHSSFLFNCNADLTEFYWIFPQSNSAGIILRRRTDGTTSDLVVVDGLEDISNDTPWMLKVDVEPEGAGRRIKIWYWNADGAWDESMLADQPETPTISYFDDTEGLDSGFILPGFGTGLRERGLDWFGFSTNGDPAPTGAITAPPARRRPLIWVPY